MSYAMTHLIIANEFDKIRNVKYKDLFLLASVSPDAVHAKKDFTFKIKADSHYLQPEENWGEIYTEEAMVKWYDRLRDFYNAKHRLVENEDDEIFLQGYTLHILTDIFNCKLLYARNLIRYDFRVEMMREEYRRECILQDNYLYQNYVESSDIMDSLINASENSLSDKMITNLQLDNFISSKNIKDNVSFLISEFRKAPTASIDNLEMLSKESTDEFLNVVLNEADRLLYTFPHVGRTFRMS